MAAGSRRNPTRIMLPGTNHNSSSLWGRFWFAGARRRTMHATRPPARNLRAAQAACMGRIVTKKPATALSSNHPSTPPAQ